MLTNINSNAKTNVNDNLRILWHELWNKEQITFDKNWLKIKFHKFKSDVYGSVYYEIYYYYY